MGRCCRIRVWRSGILTLAFAFAASAGGCALFPADEPADPRLTDTLGQGLRGIPDESPSAPSKPARKQPFWEKYRDKRVQQINEHLSVDEPAGW